LIKLDKEKIEKTRTLSKIHLSSDAAGKLPLEMVEDAAGDYDTVSSDGRDTLLGLPVVVNPYQYGPGEIQSWSISQVHRRISKRFWRNGKPKGHGALMIETGDTIALEVNFKSPL
jgi:hypothetical protein